MAKELYSNYNASYGTATLNGAITSGATSALTHGLSNLPGLGNYTVKIDDEIILVTATSGVTLTIVRAQEGTTAAAHADGSLVVPVLTDGSLRRLAVQSHGGTIVSSRRQINLIDAGGITWTLTDDSGNDKVDISGTVSFPGGEASFTAPPSHTSFTWDNQGSAGSMTDLTQGLYLKNAFNGAFGDQYRLIYMAAPAAPWTLVVKIQPYHLMTSKQNSGVVFYDSVSKKFAGFRRGSSTAIASSKWNSTASGGFNADYKASNALPGSPFLWVKLIDDGTTNRTISLSNDGNNWMLLHSIGRTDFLTADSAAIFINGNENNATEEWDAALLLQSWSLSSGVH